MSLQLRITGNDGVTNLGLAKITAPENYEVHDGGKTGNSISFVSGTADETIKIPLNITVNEFTITYWYKDKVEYTGESRHCVGYGSKSGEIDGLVTQATPEWTFGIITSKDKETLEDMFITLGNYEYCDIRVYDHKLSTFEIALIKRATIFDCRLGRPASSYKSTSVFGLEDSSGFGYSLSVDGVISDADWITDAPIGMGSLHLDGNFELKIPDISMKCSEFTLSFWMKCDDWGSISDCSIINFGETSRTGINISSGKMISSIVTTGEVQSIECIVTDLSSGWHMVTLSRNTKETSMYIDGNQVATKSGAYVNDIEFTSGSIGKKTEKPSVSFGICSIHLCTSFMSSEDVMLLYNTRISIDSSGNLYAYSNSDDSELGFGKNGNVKGLVKETGDIFKMYSSRIECNHFYEM